MIKNNFVFYSSKVIIELAEDLLYFPLWWYSKGLWRVLLSVQGFLADMSKSLGLVVWLRNLFVPMFGQRDIVGRLISFFMRFFQIIFRSLVFLLLSLLGLSMILLWLIIPIYVCYQIIWQFM